MRLTTLLLTAAILQANASGLAQTVTVSGKNIPLKKLFSTIKQQTGYVIFSNAIAFKDAHGFTLSVRDMPLRTLLDSISNDLNLTYVIKEKTIVLSRKTTSPVTVDPVIASAFAPPAKVSGVVRTSEGEPLGGASISLKGQTVGKVTSAKGEFSLSSLPENAVLIVSMLGYEPLEISIRKLNDGYTAVITSAGPNKGSIKVSSGNNVTIDITLMSRETKMNDVVVTGYMTIDKNKYVGAVTTVDPDKIKVAGETSIDQMLQGHVPGMLVTMSSGQVGSTPKIRVRGTSTILGNQEPLWVVDGVIQRDPLPMPNGSGSLAGDMGELRLIASNAISWLNPNDIESITVLKDASATAIYGSQAANGVIVLTTKKPKPGQMAVNYTGSYTVGQRPRYSMYDLMNSQELMQFSKEVYEARDSYTYEVLPIGYGGLIQKLQNKEIDQATLEREYRKMETMNTDWFDLLFRNAFSQNHSISISGGTEKLSNRTSFNVQQQKGEAIGNDLLTFSATSNTTARFNDRLTVNFLLNGTVREADGFAYGVDPFEYAYNTSRTIPMYNDDGTLAYHYKRGNSSNSFPSKFFYNYNIQNELNNTNNNNSTKSLSSTVDARLKITKDLQYQGLFSYNIAATDVKSYATELSNYITQFRGYEFGSVLSNSPQELASALPFGGLVQLQSSTNRGYTLRNSLVYNKVFNDKHAVTAQLGTEARSTITEGSMNTRYGYLRYRGEQFAPVPLVVVSNGNGTATPLHEAMRQNSSIVNTELNYLSEYFSGVYAYDQRYIFNVNARLDASNRFGQDKNKRFQPTWSIGGKWRIGNEPFLSGLHWLNSFDLSASYGYQGNTVEAVSPYLIATDGGLSSLFKQYTLSIKSLPYLELGWEKTKSWNFGLDFSFLSGRLNATFNYYKKISNVLASREVPVENGMNSATVFGSEMENKGYDLIVNVVPVRTKDFTWQFSVNTGLARNTLKENQRINTRADFLNGQAIVNGQSYSTFYSYSYKGLNHSTGRPEFNNMDIKLTANDLDYLVKSGKLEPDFSGGFNTSVRYKSFSFSAQFAMAFGAQKRLPVFYNNSGAPTPEQNVPRLLNDRWKQPGDEAYTNIPSVPAGNPNRININLPTIVPFGISPYEMYNNSDLRVADVDFIRCRQISLAYDLPQTLVKKIRSKRMNVGFSLANPFLVSFDDKWNGYDPETGGWPARRTASLSINMSL
ncbi:SusC/RagA family TonB-linked outer membrane protein [Pseudobacter ginsenosidimutans]|uniref:TonB-linked SusC/RagA family outer membrane protein n=1 Tax=Pseudobacter ginsenosidimutans TaxID=661488 RepID=A0A4Q7MUK5_9BACT|nr:SusC/RagA family TonB-linked outer membrane protein [Pseudobacter ginsenosidimutans]QEC42409.1 SusC/RagA family TonB-linked outer membrane protein [Pseudobacter ginsenosidimutans]RZS70740.1 TonB-linked SusC/RagA family outer membrane protein [Pseudobacter ginsenosidimutans]